MIAMNIPQAADETYEDVRKMIYKMANDAVHKHGGDFDEYVSAGHEAFMDAYVSYKPEHETAFSTWLWWKIRGAITGTIKKQYKWRERLDAQQAVEDVTHVDRFTLQAFTTDLSDDARTVVELLMQTPEEAIGLLHAKHTGRRTRTELFRKLRGLRWTVLQIADSFREIREALR